MRNEAKNDDQREGLLARAAQRLAALAQGRSAGLGHRFRAQARASLLRLLKPCDDLSAREDASPAAIEVLPLPSALEGGSDAGITAPTHYHDASVVPLLVRVNAGVLDRLIAEFGAHRCTEEGRNETGWVPIGYVDPSDSSIAITGLLSKGPGAKASPCALEIDHAYVYAALLLFRSRSRDSVVGLIHSHPKGMTWNSERDLRTDRAHVLTLRDGVGIYPILTHARKRTGHQLSLENRLSWWAMSAGQPGVYRPCLPQVLPGEDEAAWVEHRAKALEQAAELATSLRRSGLDVGIEPVTGDSESLDLIASQGDRRLVRRYDPLPGPVILVGPEGGLRLTDPNPDPVALAAEVTERLSSLKVSAAS